MSVHSLHHMKSKKSNLLIRLGFVSKSNLLIRLGFVSMLSTMISIWNGLSLIVVFLFFFTATFLFMWAACAFEEESSS